MKKLLFLFLLVSNIVNAQSYDDVLKKYPNFNGVVLVANKGKIAYKKAAGLSNIQEKIDLKTNSIFRICSITKTFTAAIILQLLQENKLSLDDKIGKYLPNYHGEAKDKVNIHQLLTYSSGIKNLDQNTEEMYALKLPIDSILIRYCSGNLVTEPGNQFDYKNAEYIILGKIIETIENKPFATVLQARILDKTGMMNSGMLSNAKVINSLANSYLFDSKTLTYSNDDPYWIENFYASGAMYSTVEDLLIFDQALFNNMLLNKQTLEIMLKPNPHLWNVAYGFWVTENEYLGKKYWCADRQGSISGSNATWLHLIKENNTVIIFGNSDAVNLNDLRTELVEISLKKN
ncbi:MAG: serine hydrolase [Bacteroidetes bacterium B1(2017)]|nr:MAG: serine hydrolase [Bacteroidetes bacterium B1(2017)]